MTPTSAGRTTPLVIGNCSGFFGDRRSAARELVDSTALDVLTGDWLAELTMTILQRQRARDPLKGFAPTFLRQLEEVLGTCLDRGIRIVSNAGGLNPAGCAAAVEQLAERLGLRVTVGHVSGDDVLERLPQLQASRGLTSLDDGLPLELDGRAALAANAYLGGWGIADCLSRGADVVVTGRVTDAAVVVGPAAWAFGWATDDWDRLAGAVVAGHVIECGAQATGGNYAFFDEVPGRRRLGFPVAELHPDGSSVITKAPGSGGEVSVGTVTAQLLYEVGGPRYANPDVTARLDTVELAAEGPDRVRISGAKGEPPPPGLKVSLAVAGGYRNSMMLALTGEDPLGKAAFAQEALWALVPGGQGAFDEVDVEVLGRPVEDPGTFGEATCLLRIAVAGQDEQLVGRGFSSAVIETGLSSYPGFFTSSPPGGASKFAVYRPAVVPAAEVSAVAEVGGVRVTVPSTGADVSSPLPVAQDDPAPSPTGTRAGADTVRVPLGRVAGTRSGDKGGHANLGVWVRDPAAYDWLVAELTVERLRELVPDTDSLVVRRHLLPRLSAVNFVLERFLGDGVSSCLRFDGQAKGLGEFLRSRHVDVPRTLLPATVGRGTT